MKKVLVLGGAGFIGSHMVKALLDKDLIVHIIDNLSLGKRELVQNLCDSGRAFLHVADAAEEGVLVSTMEQEGPFDMVFHLAANSDIQKSAQDPGIEFHNTFMTSYRVLEAMKLTGCKRLLFASTSAIYGDKKDELIHEEVGGNRPVSYYGGAKLASESFISSFAFMNDIQTWICRFPNVVGDNATHGVIYDFVKRLRADPTELLVLGDGCQTKPYIFVDDLIQAMFFILDNAQDPYNIYNIGVDTTTSVSTIALIVLEEMGLMGTPIRYTGGSTGWKGDVPRFNYDNSKLRALGWAPKLQSDEAVRKTVQMLLET